jgi:hypothetical protein
MTKGQEKSYKFHNDIGTKTANCKKEIYYYNTTRKQHTPALPHPIKIFLAKELNTSS